MSVCTRWAILPNDFGLHATERLKACPFSLQWAVSMCSLTLFSGFGLICSFFTHLGLNTCTACARPTVLYFLLDEHYLFWRLYFFSTKKIIRTEKYTMLKKYSALKKKLKHFFPCAPWFFLAQMPEILEVVKKVLWVILWATLGKRGVCGEPMMARVMKQL